MAVAAAVGYRNANDPIYDHTRTVGKIGTLYKVISETMVNSDTDYSGSPYGDLQEAKAQHAAFAYNSGHDDVGVKESTARLINNKSNETPDKESGLAMAVVDILSCCDPDSAEGKVLQAMGTRIHEKGNFADEEKRDLFSDEYQKRPSSVAKFSPSKLLESMKSNKSSGSTYSVRSSSSFAGPGEKRNKKSGCSYGVAAVFFILAVIVFSSAVIIAISASSRNNSLAVGSEAAHPMKDCTLVSEQDHPNVLSQCACHGSITVISEKAKDKYNNFLEAFGAEYLQPRETIDSCSARNQALVWLAEDDGSTLSDVLIQRHALVLFFVKLKGLEWTLEEEHQKWLTSDHECTWFGVACNEDKEVTAIDLWDLNLNGPLPKELMSLTSLERLALPENKITGQLPVDAFVMMSKLTDLSLFMNSISGSIDGQIFDSVTQLRTLNLDSNDLSGPIPTEVGKLSNLLELKVRSSDTKVEDTIE